ncbi:MAG: hypothetical protein ACK5PS_15285 [Desulfopila sp.]
MEKGYKRKTIFIKKRLQGRLILSASLFFCGSILLCLTGWRALSSAGSAPVGEQGTIGWVILALCGVALVISSVLLSQPIAGPLYRFERVLDHMNNGNLTSRIQLRQKDEGRELATKINTFNATLTHAIDTLDRSTAALDVLLSQVESRLLVNEENEQLASLFWSMREHNRRLREAFSPYHTNGRRQ